VSHFFVYLLLVGSACLGSVPNFCFSFMVFRPVDHLGELDDLGSGCPDVLQLRVTGAGGAADRCPRGVPRGRGGRGAGWELMASRLRALNGHIARRMCRALHLGV
jgi:hypothetical protein